MRIKVLAALMIVWFSQTTTGQARPTIKGELFYEGQKTIFVLERAHTKFFVTRENALRKHELSAKNYNFIANLILAPGTCSNRTCGSNFLRALQPAAKLLCASASKAQAHRINSLAYALSWAINDQM